MRSDGKSRREFKYVGLTLIVALATAIGCSSIRTTVLTMSGDGWINGQSNGVGKRFGMTRPYRGVPVKLKVPAYLCITVYENAYIYDDGKTLNEYQLSAPDRWVDQRIVDAEKVFLVDFARPLSGTSSHKLDIDEKSGYFTSVTGTVTDTSITDISKLVAASASLVLARGPEVNKTQTQTLSLAEHLLIEKRVVAERYFNINDCDLDAQVAAFIDEHVNCDHSCANAPGDGKCSRSVAPTSCDCSIPKAKIYTKGQEAPAAELPAPEKVSANPPAKPSIVKTSRLMLPSPTPAGATDE
ncbi:MAG: hypothetical protein F2840_13145 [Actinobacteria bacterium]|nr:hypothetical protein [Actinomycetota bacterium]